MYHEFHKVNHQNLGFHCLQAAEKEGKLQYLLVISGYDSQVTLLVEIFKGTRTFPFRDFYFKMVVTSGE